MTEDHGSPKSSKQGVVLSGTGGVWQVLSEHGERLDVSLRGRLKQGRESVQKLATGDVVTLERDARGSAWSISAIEPRRSRLARRAPGGAAGERTVAANLDQVLVVFAAAKPEPHPRMLDRFLVIAEGNNLSARIVINKVDLVGVECARTTFTDYLAAGYPMHFTSAKQQIGLEELRVSLSNLSSVLSGPSGVGKSSLLNAMFPGLNLRVGEISESVNKGRHTTVGAFAHPLPGGGFVVDTPGLREIGLWGLPPEGLDQCFPEMRVYIDQCRFGDCVHIVEPDCAVRAAVAAGAISKDRYESYLKLRAEVEETEKKYGDPGAGAQRRR
jgi:ribosome biogenesis GTPase / thiamine phosphate phosphatase